jgi:hypothetical protein
LYSSEFTSEIQRANKDFSELYEVLDLAYQDVSVDPLSVPTKFNSLNEAESALLLVKGSKDSLFDLKRHAGILLSEIETEMSSLSSMAVGEGFEDYYMAFDLKKTQASEHIKKSFLMSIPEYKELFKIYNKIKSIYLAICVEVDFVVSTEFSIGTVVRNNAK